MKNSKYKLHKQIGIQELLPFKLNIKLFRNLIISKFLFLYYFYRRHITKRYKKIKPLVGSRSIPNMPYKSKYRYFNKNYWSRLSDYNKAKYYNNLRSNNNSYKNVNYIFDVIEQQKRYIPFYKMLYKLNKANKGNRKGFNYRAVIKSLALPMDPLIINLNNIPTSPLNKLSFGIKINTLTYFSRLKELFLNMSIFKTLYKGMQKNKKYYFSYYSKYKHFLNCYYNKIKLVNSLLNNNIFVSNSKYKLIFNKLKQINSVYYKFLCLLHKKYQILLNIANYITFKYKYLKYSFSNNVSYINSDSKSSYWLYLIQFFFMGKVNKLYKLKYINPRRIQSLLYRKYISELKRSNIFYNFVMNIINYKQRKQIKKFFIHLYRQNKYYNKKRKNKRHTYIYFKGILSYYKVQQAINSILNNRPIKKYYYLLNKYKIRLYQLKVMKIIYGFKSTKVASKFFTNLNKKHTNPSFYKSTQTNIINSISNFLNSNSNNKNRLVLNNKYKNYSIFNLKFGDSLRLDNSKNLESNLSNILLKYVNNLIIILKSFREKKFNIVKSFSFFDFHLKTIIHKLSYILLFYSHKQYNKIKLLYKFTQKQKLLFISNNKAYLVDSTKKGFSLNNNLNLFGRAINLDKANMNEFYRFKFRKNKKVIEENKQLKFYNFFDKLSFKEKYNHNQYHILKIDFILTNIKKMIFDFICMDFLVGKYSVLLVNSIESNTSRNLYIVDSSLGNKFLDSLVTSKTDYSELYRDEFITYKSFVS